MKGFRDFILRGNLLELAVAFIMGAAFNDVVNKFSKVIMDFVTKVIGGQPNFDSVTLFGIAVGPFLTALVSFLLTATVVYFAIVKPANLIRDKLVKKEAEPSAAPTETELLTEIRDLLKKAS